MKIAVAKPSYLPRIDLFEQFRQCDAVVIDDDGLFDRRARSARARIKSPAGAGWLSVPVLTDTHRWNTFRDVRVDSDRDWPGRHLTLLRDAYARSPHFDGLISVLEPIITEPWLFLLDLEIELLHALTGQLGLDTRLVCASSLRAGGSGVDRRVRICRQLGATCLLTGEGAQGRRDEAAFAAAGVRIEHHQYVHPRYQQAFGPFVPNLSVVDLLFNHGPDSLAVMAGTTPSRAVRAA